ncbi:hypothetical protein BVX94_02110 [bacterium B17]|nr:hypothetical protein BVX94_02110 [bacterium B17]
MIFDKVENWQVYGNGEIWKTAFQFLLTLNEDTEDGEYPLLGKEMFARVMSYETKKPEDAVLEGHKKYIDIQSSIRIPQAM